MHALTHHGLLLLSIGGVLDTVGDFLGGALGTLDNLRKKVFGAIKSVYTFAVHIFGWVGTAWETAWHAFTSSLHWLEHAVESAYTFSAWLIEHWIPDQIKHVAGDVAALASTLAHHALTWAKEAAAAVAKALTAAVNAVADFARHSWTILHGHVLDILGWIRNTAEGVVDLVTHPDRLVRHIIPALLGPLLALLTDSAKLVMRTLLGFWRAHADELAHDFEDVLTDVF